jgi:hypothetical protein
MIPPRTWVVLALTGWLLALVFAGTSLGLFVARVMEVSRGC